MNATEPKPVQRPGHSWFSSLSGRIAMAFCTMTLLLLLVMQLSEMYGLPFGLFEGEIREATTQELEQLSSAADANKKILELWISERRGDSHVIANLPNLAQMAARSTAASLPSLVEWLNAISYSYHYASVRILDPASGKTIVGSDSSQAAPPLPEVILNSARRPGYEETIFFTAGSAGHPPRLHFIRQIGQDQGSDEMPAMLLDLSVDFEAALNLLWEKNRSGILGKSGETVVVNNSFQFINVPRYPLADGKPVIPLLTINNGKPARLAVEGGDGTIVAPDYRGVKVLAAYRHIPLSPEISWGLVVKIDEKEALEPVRDQLLRAVIYMAAASVITLFSTIFLARRLSRPLRRIAHAARKIEVGDLSQRVIPAGSSEIVALGQSFNAMVERLAQSQESLELKVKERTEELLNLTVRQEALLEAVPDIIMEVDINRVYTWGNSAGIQFFGDDVLGREAAFYFEGEQDTYQQTVPLIEGSADVLYVESWQRRRDGQIRLLAWWCKALRDTQGVVTGGLSTARDITELKKAEEEKHLLEQQFQQTQKLESLGVLAGGIAHDFNNILAIIMGYCSIIKMDYEDAEKHLPEVEKAAERAAALCRQMLAYAGKATLTQSQVDTRMLVDEMVTMLKTTIKQNVVIKPDLATDIPTLTGDASQLRQVVMNLIINAAEAIGDADGEIDVKLVKTEIRAEQAEKDHLGFVIPAGRYICFEVTDNGCGMDEETIRKIFEPFYTTKFTGRGLGMSAVLGIIKAHNGVLQLESRLGHGTTFKVYLPVQTSRSETEEAQQKAASAPWRGSGTILLAEDEVQVKSIAIALLQNLGFTVLDAANGREALELYQQNAADITLVITDMGMPVMNGYELFYKLKQLDPQLPIIISSGFGEGDIASKIPREAMAGMINKPYNFDQFREVLRGVVE